MLNIGSMCTGARVIAVCFWQAICASQVASCAKHASPESHGFMLVSFVWAGDNSCRLESELTYAAAAACL